MKNVFKSTIVVLMILFFSTSLIAQSKQANTKEITVKTNFSDREAILETINNFYIGDQTGSVKHKKLSMHEKGAYRYVDRNGKYGEGTFQLDTAEADTSYKRELLSIEIYETIAVAKLRHENIETGKPHYKLLTMHKAGGNWKITSINWGFEIIQ